MKIKIVVILIVVIVVGFIARKRFAPSVENTQVEQVADRNTTLRAGLNALKDSKGCQNVPDKSKCIVEFVGKNGGISFATDLGLYSATIMTVCRSDGRPCVFETFDRVIPLIDVDKIKSNLPHELVDETDPKFIDAYRIQLSFLRTFLANHRHRIEMTAKSLKTEEDKSAFERYLKTVDTELATIPAAP